MALEHLVGCNQAMFRARPGGACWGISIEFCKHALDTGDAVQAIYEMFDRISSVARKAESHMQAQQLKVHDVARPMYVRDELGNIDANIENLSGRLTQNTAIQVRHNVITEMMVGNGIKNIGTLSSYYEGGTGPLIETLILLSKKAGNAATLFDLQQPLGHTVVLHYSGEGLHFFDPNDGLWRVDLSTAVADLVERFMPYTFTFGHLLVKKN
ncbi:YopT-type cysteine protease domain-containing protein [Janthinobacterium sp. SUN118]|uniref:YopT-type cysteine protease domain-containing protein n=1 Tax=Janthinobacterium sp. SUN118 TaxID=3004100 RepID=UPI0025AF6035|nr:YopT-type cysteine protease domain-containing protein [Janthinobacterium sp. SUN118]MDN2710558.1 YopT-type cysteine protease domain-containing protein [Janthinobacterium sp. SUN118]